LQQDFGSQDLAVRAREMLADNDAGLRTFLLKTGLPVGELDRTAARLSAPGALVGAMSWEHSIASAGFESVPTVQVPTLYVWSRGPALSEATVQATRSFVSAHYEVMELPGAGNFML